MKKCKIMLLGILCGGLVFSAQASLKSEMIKMENATNELLQVNNVMDFQHSAQKLIQIIEDSLNHIPPKIMADDERAIEDYHYSMQKLIDVIEESKEVADSGRLNEAKAKVKKLFELKARYHLEYK